VKSKTYYELLGVAPHVGTGQIQAAYRFARSLYSGEATPTYGILDADERSRMLVLVEDAYAALSNPNARRDYDAQLSAQRGVPASAPAVSAPPQNSEKRRAEKGPARISEPLPVSPPPEAAAGPPLSVPDAVTGSTLRALRESRGLSIDQIAALGKVGSRFLQALEEDRHGALPGRVFARGFLIEYARALRVSESDLVDRYLRNWPAPK
jgi:curved DNA-binding protein CbpA